MFQPFFDRLDRCKTDDELVECYIKFARLCGSRIVDQVAKEDIRKVVLEAESERKNSKAQSLESTDENEEKGAESTEVQDSTSATGKTQSVNFQHNLMTCYIRLTFRSFYWGFFFRLKPSKG